MIKRITIHYTITTQRLHIKRGIISREIQETRLERVQNVNYDQSVLQRMLQIGDVDFDTAAGDDYNFVFEGVDEPEDVVQRVERGDPDSRRRRRGRGRARSGATGTAELERRDVRARRPRPRARPRRPLGRPRTELLDAVGPLPA